jgi:hypothetical protein
VTFLELMVSRICVYDHRVLSVLLLYTRSTIPKLLQLLVWRILLRSHDGPDFERNCWKLYEFFNCLIVLAFIQHWWYTYVQQLINVGRSAAYIYKCDPKSIGETFPLLKRFTLLPITAKNNYTVTDFMKRNLFDQTTSW